MVFRPVNVSNEKNSAEDDRCINNKDMTKFDDLVNNWTVQNCTFKMIKGENICRDTYAIVHFTNPMPYGEAAKTCKLMNGRLLFPEEIIMFQKELFESGVKRLKQMDTSRIQRIGTWLPGGNESADELRYRSNIKLMISLIMILNKKT